jgi:hypothetical protein
MSENNVSSIHNTESIIGRWQIKRVKQKAVYDALKKASDDDEKLKFSNLHLFSLSFSLTKAINKSYEKKRKEKEFLYKEILTFLKMIKDDFKNEFKDITHYDNSITIPNVIKYFQKQNIVVKKEFILSLYNDDYIFKSYHKIRINQKGIEYIKLIK